ncbi:SEC-C metal-binding domain-containing protein, partial [Pseudomonadales bacterium]|nr:SEC-C metal-binding domain-containing protein [Pseudomonadales bacterium]
EAKTSMNFQKSDAGAMDSPGATQGAGSQQEGTSQAPFIRQEKKVGRNEPCPCGSGKKYKSCHGKLS